MVNGDEKKSGNDKLYFPYKVPPPANRRQSKNFKITNSQGEKVSQDCGDSASNSLSDTYSSSEYSTDEVSIASQFSVYNAEEQLRNGSQANTRDAFLSLPAASVFETQIYAEELSDSRMTNFPYSSPSDYMYYDSEAYEDLEDNCQCIMSPSTRNESSDFMLETRESFFASLIAGESLNETLGGDNDKLEEAKNEQQYTKQSPRQYVDLPLQLYYYYEDDSKNEIECTSDGEERQERKFPATFDAAQIDNFEVEALKVDPNDHTAIFDYFFLHDPLNSQFCRHSKLEKHGWVFLLGIQIPYIYRGVCKYSSLFMVENAYREVFRAFQPMGCFSNCIEVPTVYATPQEMALLSFMTDEVYRYSDYYCLMVGTSEVMKLFNFLHHCILRAWRIPIKRPFGLLRIAGHLVPYVKVGKEKAVPFVFLKRHVEISEPVDVILSKWKLAFIKFICKIIGKEEEVLNETTLPAIYLKHLYTKLPVGVQVEPNIWPKRSSYFKGVVPSEASVLKWTSTPDECVCQ